MSQLENIVVAWEMFSGSYSYLLYVKKGILRCSFLEPDPRMKFRLTANGYSKRLDSVIPTGFLVGISVLVLHGFNQVKRSRSGTNNWFYSENGEPFNGQRSSFFGFRTGSFTRKAL